MQPQDRLDPTMLPIVLDSTQGNAEESVITIYKKCFLNTYMSVYALLFYIWCPMSFYECFSSHSIVGKVDKS